MQERELAEVQGLLAAHDALLEAMEAARIDIESIGLAEGDAFIAFEILEEMLADIGDLLDEAAGVAELAGVDAAYDSLGELLQEHEDAVEAFREQAGDVFQYLRFDIEDILVDMPPLNKDRLDDDDAILYSALELSEMTEPWRNVMRLAEGFIQLRLARVEACLTALQRRLGRQG